MITFYFFLIAACYGFAQYLRYIRWSYLLRSIPGWNFDKTFRGFILGQFLNIFVPFKIGDIVRAGSSSTRVDSIFLVFMTLIAERMLDALYLFPILLLFLGYKVSVIYILGFLVIIALLFIGLPKFMLNKMSYIDKSSLVFQDYLAISISVISKCLKKGMEIKSSFVTIFMWLLNGFATLLLAFFLENNMIVTDVVNSLYLNFAAPSMSLHVISVYCIVFSLMLCTLFKYCFRKAEAPFFSDSRQKPKGMLPSTTTSLNQLAIILNNSGKNERPVSVFAGGSGSVTLLMEDLDTKKHFVRKYSSIKTADVLIRQSKFLATFHHPAVVKASNLTFGPTAVSFDMPYLESYTTFTDLILTANPSRLKLVTETIVETHKSLFHNSDSSIGLNSFSEEYLINRTNPKKRLTPILREYLIQNPDSTGLVHSLLDELQNFHEKLLKNERFTYLENTVGKIHGDFSSSNIMVGSDSNVVFIDLVYQDELSTLVNDFSKLYFSVLSGFDATFNLLLTTEFWNNSNKPLPNLVNLNSLHALDILEKYVYSVGGDTLLREVRALSFMQLIRVLPYRLAQDKQNSIRWLIWAIDFTNTLATKIR
jgi:serine/threonine protein kinase